MSAEADMRPEPLCYLHHGPTGLERLSPAEVERRAATGEVLWLSQALAIDGAADLLWMVEGKRGVGPLEAALGACARAFAARGARGRMLFAHSSLGALEVSRRGIADVPTAVFASHIFRSGKMLHVPKTCVWEGLRHGLFVDPAALPVDLVSCVNPLSAGRPCARPQLPIARSWEEARALARRGMAGAFCYFGERWL